MLSWRVRRAADELKLATSNLYIGAPVNNALRQFYILANISAPQGRLQPQDHAFFRSFLLKFLPLKKVYGGAIQRQMTWHRPLHSHPSGWS